MLKFDFYLLKRLSVGYTVGVGSDSCCARPVSSRSNVSSRLSSGSDGFYSSFLSILDNCKPLLLLKDWASVVRSSVLCFNCDSKYSIVSR